MICDAVTTLAKYVDEEISSIKLCTECYTQAHTNEKNLFEMPHHMPHPIVWAQSEEFQYWPAKLMAIETQEVCKVVLL